MHARTHARTRVRTRYMPRHFLCLSCFCLLETKIRQKFYPHPTCYHARDITSPTFRAKHDTAAYTNVLLRHKPKTKHVLSHANLRLQYSIVASKAFAKVSKTTSAATLYSYIAICSYVAICSYIGTRAGRRPKASLLILGALKQDVLTRSRSRAHPASPSYVGA